MRYSAKAIVNFQSVNSFDYDDQWTIRSGEPNTLYFQLVDLDQDELRYFTGLNGSASINVTFPSIDDTKVITIAAAVNANDPSIWAVTLTSTQTPNTGSVLFKITEGANVRSFSVQSMIAVEFPGANGSC